MTDKEREYDAIARRFDGEEVPLSETAQRLSAEIRRDSDAIAAMLNVAVPTPALDRARRRMRAASLSTQRWRRVKRALAIGAALASVAACLFFAIQVLSTPTVPPTGIGSPLVRVPDDVIIASFETTGDDAFEYELELLAEQLSQAEADLAVGSSDSTDLLDGGIRSLQTNINEFWDTDPMWNLAEES